MKFFLFLKILTEYTSREVYSLWGRVGKMLFRPIRKKRNSLLFDKWYFDPPIHGISTPLPIVYWPPYPWYFDPPSNGISTPPYTWYFDLPAYLLIRNGGVKIPWGFNLPYRGGQFSIRGFNILWMKIDPGVNLPWGSKYHMTPVHIIIKINGNKSPFFAILLITWL